MYYHLKVKRLIQGEPIIWEYDFRNYNAAKRVLSRYFDVNQRRLEEGGGPFTCLLTTIYLPGERERLEKEALNNGKVKNGKNKPGRK